MSRMTMAAALTLAVMALPLWSFASLADDAHHPAQGTQSGQAEAQAAPPPAQIPGPPAPQAPGAQAPTPGQAPAGSAPGQTQPSPPTMGSLMMDCPMMQGNMQGQMVQMMQGMMQMMQMMQTQMQMMQRQMQLGVTPPSAH